MNAVADATREILSSHSGSPFLFVGSGFSRRYLGIEDWGGLLSRFCADIESFEFYLTSANGSYPHAATLIANDFHNIWWKHEKYAASRASAKAHMTDKSSALKYEISKYLSDLDLDVPIDEKLQNEIQTLKNINADGVITTNWDLLLESIFPEYRVYVGQQELLFANPQAIAEIYKIHGCSNHPSSLILTRDDYRDFESRNPYLAAKLITIFIEHPIFFIGYSVSDPHIQEIIFSIAACLSDENLEKFSRNLIFLHQSKDGKARVTKNTFSRSGRSVTIMLFETNDFCDVYSIIEEHKRKIPARILRYCKEQMYELVRSENPEEKLAVVDFDALDSTESVEFVVGVGVATTYQENQVRIEEESAMSLQTSGYVGLTPIDLFRDLVADESAYDADILLKTALTVFAKRNSTFIPIYRYLRSAGIDTEEKLEGSDYPAAKEFRARIASSGYRFADYKRTYDINYRSLTTQEIIDKAGVEKAALFIAYQRPQDIDKDVLRNFINDNLDFNFRDPYKSAFKKVACLYDYIKYGF